MKRLLLILMLTALPYVSGANDLSVIYNDSISATDSIAATVRQDTVFTPWVDIRGYKAIHFYSYLVPYFTDTNWTNDTFFINAQTSFNRIGLKTYLVDTFLTSDSSWSPLKLNTTDSIFGNWMRGMLIHKDSMEAAADIKGNEYKKEFKLWIAPKK